MLFSTICVGYFVIVFLLLLYIVIMITNTVVYI